MTRKADEALVHEHLFEILFLVRGRMKAVVKDADAHLTPMQITIMRILAKSGPMNQATVVEKMGRDKSQVTRLLQGLESMNIITRERDVTDRRQFVLTLAPSARAKTERFIHHEEAIVKEMMAGVPAGDVTRVSQLLNQMRQNLRKN